MNQGTRFLRIFAPLTLMVIHLVPSPGSRVADYRVEKAVVEGAKCTLAVPPSWNHNLLIYAHGARSPDASLAAPVNTEAVSFRNLLREGWIVAATSYRRNGLIIRDAIADIGVLRTYVGQKYGPLRSVIVLGASMGGTIVTLLAEQASGPYQGLLAVDPALDMREPHLPMELTFRPKIPLLFLCNQNELAGPADYAARAAGGSVVPALWRVARDGHLNVNQEEVLTALQALIAWAAGGRIDATKDVTYTPPRLPSSVVFKGLQATGKVLALENSFGDIVTSFTADDLDRIGTKVGDALQVNIRGRSYLASYRRMFTDVRTGDWIAIVLPDPGFEVPADGQGCVSIARKFENAAASASAKVGDEITLVKVKP
jgi:pimeloyl-ACP methyl ester carboxylesterase